MPTVAKLELPDYASMLTDYHRGFARELRGMIAALPIREGDRVLDLACGDGMYSRWLAERVGPTGTVTSVDISPAFLALAKTNVKGGEGAADAVGFVAGTVERLPFADDSFDLAWCAQSFYDLPDPVEAVAAMRRVVKPGGFVGVLENDSFHHILLPWPVEVELAVRRAELMAHVENADKPRKYYIGRQLNRVFRLAGLEEIRKRTFANNRQAPLDDEERGYLTRYLRELFERTRPYLDGPILDRFERLVDPDSEHFLLDGPDLAVTSLDHVISGRKPLAS